VTDVRSKLIWTSLLFLCVLHVALAQSASPAEIVDIESIRLEGVPIRVFDHRHDKQEMHHLPDASLAAWKEADGTVNLMIPHFENYRMRGPNLEQLKSAPEKIFSSFQQAADLEETSYNYHHWLTAPYTLDGKTVYAVTHTEWYACLLSDDCTLRDYRLGSWTTTNNLLESQDGGKTWRVQGDRETHLVFNGAHLWTGSRALSQRIYRHAINHSGFMVPTRPIREGNYLYVIGLEMHRDFEHLIGNQAPMRKNGFAILRTKDISQASGWEVWSGGTEYKTANLSNLKVFTPEEKGKPLTVALPQIIYDDNSKRFVLFFTVYGDRKGLYYSTSRSLEVPEWTEAAQVIGTDDLLLDPDFPDKANPCNVGVIPRNYPSILDSDSRGRNFEFTDGDPWMFYVLNRVRCEGGRGNLKRDIYRVKMRFNYRTLSR